MVLTTKNVVNTLDDKYTSRDRRYRVAKSTAPSGDGIESWLPLTTTFTQRHTHQANRCPPTLHMPTTPSFLAGPHIPIQHTSELCLNLCSLQIILTDEQITFLSAVASGQPFLKALSL